MKKNNKVSKNFWFNLVLFGLMGQIAWNVENMYFNTFLYNSIYSNGATQAAINGTMPVMDAISMMVGLSAATAVITTFIMGTLSDKMRKRKVFISAGYIAWGVITALFGLISRDSIAAIFHLSDEVKILSVTVWTVIIMDSVMTFMGSTSNDSAFNAWITDVTEPKSRPRVETVLAALPIVAMGIVVGIGTLAQTGVMSYGTFFLGLGVFVICCGVIGLFTLKDPENAMPKENSNYWADLFYGFRPSVVKSNARLYLALVSSCFFAVAVQVFFPYILIYLQYVIFPASTEIALTSPKFIIAAVAAVAAMAGGIISLLKLGEKKNKTYALLPAGILFIVGLFLMGFSHNLLTFVLSAAPTVIGYAVLMIMLGASVRDFTPEGKAGQFQGIRMIFNVLIPMVLGPVIGSFASKNSGITYIDEYNVSQIAPTSNMFLYASIVAVFVFIPLGFLIKKGFEVAGEKE
ncbi:MAG: MFS transporter [Faecalibacterium sp.]|nr:MFS transporter [Ruminococcus sp.]MCM1393191.1 MFS transporter [Ruminococcus sp.]MCM1486661.1 MFS transporter [Faecalibacterium sp.]